MEPVLLMFISENHDSKYLNYFDQSFVWCVSTIVRGMYTVKPVLSGHLNIDKIKVLMENGSLMKVKSIAECSPWSILQYF